MENLTSNQMAKIHLLQFSSEFQDMENQNLSKKLISELEEEGIEICIGCNLPSGKFQKERNPNLSFEEWNNENCFICGNEFYKG